MEFATLTKTKSRNKKVNMVKRASVGAELQYLDVDKVITTDPKDHSKRRALKLVRRANSWGFTIQTYGIKHKRTNEIEIMTYVDYVDIGGAAWIAGMRAGDVILSVNGERVDSLDHHQLVSRIKQVQETLRLVVLFEDCRKKVELHERFFKLKAVLRAKYNELKELEMKEMNFLDNYCKAKGLNRFDLIRQSMVSNVSSNSDSWDAYSMVSSPRNLQSTGNYNHGYWSSVSSLKSFCVDDKSIAEEDYMNFMDSGSDSDSLGISVSTSEQGHSDSDLQKSSRASNSLKVSELVLSSSDSDLYRGKSGKDPGRRKSSTAGNKKLRNNDVFINGATDNKGENSDEGVGKSISSTGKESIFNGAISKGDNSGQENKIYYAGDDGNIIVPKIIVEGDEVFTTFDHIDTKGVEAEGDSQDLDPSLYRDKVVALEIAREMALLENINGVSDEDEGVRNGPFDIDTRSPNSVRKSVISDKLESEKNAELPSVSTSIRKTKSLVTRNTPQVLNMPPILSTKSFTAKKSRVSPMLIGKYPGFSSSAPHVCGSMSYDQLKSSVPDFVISFHTEECQVIYINEKNETTPL